MPFAPVIKIFKPFWPVKPPVPFEEIFKSVPEDKAFPTIDWPNPVVNPEYVCRNCVPAVDVVDDRSSRTPVVVDVSFEVDAIRAKEPPDAITDVVCEIMNAAPVVSALVTICWPIPVVRPEYTCKNCVPAVDVVDARSSKTPVVVDVSFEVDTMRANDPPFAITDVVCVTVHAVPVV